MAETTTRGVIIFSPPGWIWTGLLVSAAPADEIVLEKATYIATVAQNHSAWDLAQDPKALGEGWPVTGTVRIVRGPGMIVVQATEAAVLAVYTARDRATLRGGK